MKCQCRLAVSPRSFCLGGTVRLHHSAKRRSILLWVPESGLFLDTVCYIGLLPWIAIVSPGCFGAGAKLGRNETKVALFTVLLGVIGIVLSLPFVHEATVRIPQTILRSPARLIYLTEFAL